MQRRRPEEWTIPYRHTQPGYFILAVCVAIGALGAATISRTGPMPVILMLITLLPIAAVFHSLTVEVDDTELRWYFGPGFWTYRLARDEIQEVAVVRNHWRSGFGIRMRPGFRLYNVSGLDAVELQLKSGNIRRIGTDDPKGLTAALQSTPRAKA